MWRRLTLLLLTASLSIGAANAADRYTIDPDHTFPSLEFSHMGISVWRGKFNRTSGSVTLDRQARTGEVTVTVDAASIDFGLDSMNEYAIKPDWLDVAAHPVMTYQGALRFSGEQPVAVDGRLTLRGVTRPLTLSINSFNCLVHPMLKKEVCGADVEGELNRADYGMTQYSEGEAGKVRLRIQVEGMKDG